VTRKRLIDRIVTRDMAAVQVGQVVYTNWCEGEGKALDDGAVARLEEDAYRWTVAEPNLRWIGENDRELDVKVMEKMVADGLKPAEGCLYRRPTPGGLHSPSGV
jgi:glycine cleavage system aminomethyltransferase T